MSDWSLCPHMVVRSTGFPWEWVEGLRWPRAYDAAVKRAAAEDSLATLRDAAPRLSAPSRGNLARLRGGRPLPDGVVDDRAWLRDWNAAAGEAAEADRLLSECAPSERERESAHLMAVLEDARFQAAVAASSPRVGKDLRGGKLSGRLRRQAASYLQRLCAKNETAAFFGPINYGALTPAEPSAVTLEWGGAAAITARRTHLASWLLRAVSEGIAFSPEVVPWLTLRPLAVGPDALPAALKGIDGSRTLAALAEDGPASLDELAETARSAHRAGLVSHQLDLPAAELEPVRELGRRLAGLPPAARADHLRAIRRLVALLERYPHDDPDALGAACAEAVAVVSDHVGEVAPPASRGQFYADRLPLREECAGDLRLTVSGDRAHQLRAEAAPVLDLLAVAAVRTRAAARRQVARMLGKRTVPLWKVAAALPDGAAEPDDWLTDSVSALIDADGEEVGIEVLRPPEDHALDGESLLCSVDLMVAASSVESWAAGDYDLVMGDIHDTALISRWALQFHPQAVQVETELAMAIGRLPHRLPLVRTVPARKTGLSPPELPGVAAELGGPSAGANPWRVPFEDLVVDSDGQDARLRARGLASEVALHNGELDTLLHTAFSLPRIRPLGLSAGAHTPRVRSGRVIVQRRRWELTAEERAPLHAAKDDRQRLLESARLWARRGLPPQVFAHVPGERKPVLVDPSSPLLLRVLDNLAADAATIALSEMRPGPGQLWLRDDDRTHTSELRCVFLRDGGGAWA